MGKLTMGSGDIVFRTAVDTCIAAGKVDMIVDCSRLEEIDSVGVGTLAVYHSNLGTVGGKIVLLEISRTHMQLLTLAKLDTMFEIFTNEQDAVNSFFTDRDTERYDILQFVKHQAHQAHSAGRDPQPSEKSSAGTGSMSDSNQDPSIKPA
ncbi:MAG: STAS domain-containing protein [Acidobacteriaceae bacterium]|nr:STAS domain-containing protein [Acidobacteriaceae bacterium]